MDAPLHCMSWRYKFIICLQRRHDFFLKLLYDNNQQRGHTPMRFLPPKTHTTHPKNPAAYAVGFLGAAGPVQKYFKIELDV